MKKTILTIFILLLMTPAISAEKNALDYLPPSQFITAWVATGNEVFGRPESLGWLLGDGLYLLLEYEPVWFATETYARGEDELVVELFEFKNAADAFGFYSVSNAAFKDQIPEPGRTEKPYAPPPVSQIGTIRIINSEFLEGYQDRFYFRIRIKEEELYDSGTRAAFYLQTNLPGESIPAAIIGNLPRTDLVGGSERYIRGAIGLDILTNWNGMDFLGFDENPWKAVAGQYRVSGGKYYLLIIGEYEDSDMARIAATRLQNYFQDNGWDTIVLPPLPGNLRPRAFKDFTCVGFWAKNNQLWFVWDIENATDLNRALQQHIR